jgi:hypothetical protein
VRRIPPSRDAALPLRAYGQIDLAFCGHDEPREHAACFAGRDPARLFEGSQAEAILQRASARRRPVCAGACARRDWPRPAAALRGRQVRGVACLGRRACGRRRSRRQGARLLEPGRDYPGRRRGGASAGRADSE